MIDIIAHYIIPATFVLLPSLASREAALMLLAIGLQESRFLHRRQVKGPALGFWQFERIATLDVLTRGTTTRLSRNFCAAAGYDLTGIHAEPATTLIHAALEHNDVLACGFARLKMYLHPIVLPAPGTPAASWQFYKAAWRPGRPHPETWEGLYEEAFERNRQLMPADTRRA